MKVLMINHFPLEGSGSGTYTRNIASALAKRGHEVHVLMPENRSDYSELPNVGLSAVQFTPEDDSPAPSGALPFNFPCFTTHPRSTMTFAELGTERLEQYCNAFEQAIDEELASFEPDIVHGQHVWILPALAADKGVPLVLTAHGTDLMGYDKWPELRGWAERAIDASKTVITISKDSKKLLESVFPQYADKSHFMRNGYDAGLFRPCKLDRASELGEYDIAYDGEPLVLIAGKLTHFKGIDVALRAAALYERELGQVLTVIAGDGSERENLEALENELGLTSVHFIGNVALERLQRLYAIADVSLVPSRREPFGLVAIEALACGTPVVASNQGGLPDFVNDEVGALFEPENHVELAEKVVATLARTNADNGWRERIAAYAKGSYSQDVIIEDLESVYEQAIRQH